MAAGLLELILAAGTAGVCVLEYEREAGPRPPGPLWGVVFVAAMAVGAALAIFSGAGQ